MAQMKIRHLVSMPGRDGLTRYYWQPSKSLRAAGWTAQRVPADWANYRNPVALEGAAIAAAQALNASLDARRVVAEPAVVRLRPAVAQRTLGDLIQAYQASQDWIRLAEQTQRGYRKCLVKLQLWGGDAPVRTIDAARIQKLIEALRATPAYANAVARVLRLLLEHGRRHGWLDVNPALRPGLTSTAPTGLIWPRAAVTVFAAAADELGRHSIGTAILLNEWLGQREGDILRLPRHVLRNGALWIRQSKTGAGVALPVEMVPHLIERLQDEEARQHARVGEGKPLPMTLIVSEETGLPYKEDNFRRVFAAIRARAAEMAPEGFEVDHLMPGRDMRDPGAFTIHARELTFMQLRHTAVTRLAEADCDTGLICTITGHSQDTATSIIERYLVKTAKMARMAFQRRLDAEAPAQVSTVQGAAG